MCIINFEENSNILINIENARKIRLISNTNAQYTQKTNENKQKYITELLINQNTIKLQDKIKVGHTVFKCNYIEMVKDNVFEIYEDKLNYSSILLLPAIDMENKKKGMYGVDDYMINTFIDTEKSLFILYIFKLKNLYICK